MDETMKVKLDGFEGPLDLLLHLIKTLEIDIYDIPMTLITEQYMEYVEAMKELSLDQVSKYMVMAATLLSIKSKMLLPVEESKSELEDYEDPRQELVEQLLEYQKYKEASEWFEQQQVSNLGHYTRESAYLEHYVTQPLLSKGVYQPLDLKAMMEKIIQRQMTEEPPKTINRDELTIEEQMGYLSHLLKQQSSFVFQDILPLKSPSFQVTSFLALLEMMKEKSILVHQKDTYGPIKVEKRE